MELHELKYVSPSGKEFSFDYENFEKETDLKTSTFTFPEKDGAYIQSLGRGGRRFPMHCIFSGSDAIEKADAFEVALEERGVGVLVHPVYGRRNVVPTGSIKRQDGVVSNIGEATVDVTFSETLNDNNEILKGSQQKASDIEATANAFAESATKDFQDTIAFCSICGAYHKRSI